YYRVIGIVEYRTAETGPPSARARGSQTAARRRDHGLGGDAELPVERREIGGGAEVLQRDDLARVAGEPVPRLRDSGLDDHPGPHRRRKDLLPVGPVLAIEPLHTGHGHHPRGHPVRLEYVPGLDSQL